jgi:hypothetical protein
VLLNASTTQDAEAQLLTFVWRDGATEITQQGPVIDYLAPAAGPRTISLTVTDPGGLTSSTSKTVTVLP